MSLRLAPARLIVFACVCFLNTVVCDPASAQTPGQIAAKNARNRAVQNALQQGAVPLPANSLPRISRQSAERYRTAQSGYGYPSDFGYSTNYGYSGNGNYGYPTNYGYSGGYGYPGYGYPNGFGGYNYGGYNPQFGSGYGNYGYGQGYGYGYGTPVYVSPVVPSNSQPSNNTNRLPGSNYFGPPHASQYMGR
jgi:hypothetical protein